ncbi:hypothetical protein V1512DRAFT_213566 [Lipomyces arxii]|uniref:uncharacterized protein n=1 Tax=Lipomyces arxii TaxID=56418 RepID=UPI0034CDCC8A
MDYQLRCNNHHCRRHLSQQGVVTTCRLVFFFGFNHIFCIQCANKAFPGERICPACDTLLNEPDVQNKSGLNTFIDLSRIVLAGLSPSVINEICSRALAFWTYQCSQELLYQEYLGKSLTEKFNKLNQHLERVVRDANSEIGSSRNRCAAMKTDLDIVTQRNQELLESLQDKTRQFTKLQQLYDKLKRKTLFGPLQTTTRTASSDIVPSAVEYRELYLQRFFANRKLIIRQCGSEA